MEAVLVAVAVEGAAALLPAGVAICTTAAAGVGGSRRACLFCINISLGSQKIVSIPSLLAAQWTSAEQLDQ
jgi:hypothetical protein